ncbi:MAG: protein-L-isoaspartate(D-aspartate) O-methyltransferase, partial [Nitrosopumilaceae archaeon]|nr:protein-L-isoaspartate(D-aspartate) O-methyltransferase [Nitrosopumilaceae archaeon]NIU87741.1 protein-L-isoaspartate(D-aspartate) O-methyltransferase [Nitrosopumilaceae archaeon]NIV66118.1 protein-L-isoaspartate(D-aspartate) O-methyltransferase [Nitrosopumilaceae archaeon]NIX61985.1 protein-L-isoaspartate(D-aspartate) O-methyltransferase [Nitrosopumilaceae archaeon]
RELFLPKNYVSSAYSDHPLPLMDTGQTISAPHMTIMILEYLELKPGLRVLEVGAGSGYQAALIAAAIKNGENTGHIYSIEIVPKLVDFARRNIRNAGYEDLITVLEGDGTLGLPEEAPFDRIILTAAGPTLPPPLLEQLKIEGTLVMPLGRPGLFQTMTRFRKISEDEVLREVLTSVAFVPLRGKYGS